MRGTGAGPIPFEWPILKEWVAHLAMLLQLQGKC
jgi:hypothetical protein